MNIKQFITGAVTLVFALIGAAKAQNVYPAKAEDISPLLIGEQLPSVYLTDAAGSIFELNKALAAKPTILIFYRGGWCPYCNLQLSGLQEIEEGLKNTGYQVIAVSTDKPDNLKQSMEKGKLSYTLLSDADLNLAKQVGIAFKAPEAYQKMLVGTTGGKDTDMLLPVPSIFILNRSGEIRFEYIEPNFKERISPELLKAVAKALYKDL
ncbi:peroxiredoxin-like family protein [Pedobacter africanus]|uniref:thioredoxin-dependent peroxiredoxin n=1 Tax=Pedobacter africanus TaxID=151894 RepID=A0A1W1Z191_9SPHI|nr:peroxiredoxin-like family protein [Pedobacter africanus]SMC42082.1 Peroxiredoxin [Pedobacter africanus]